MIQRLLVILLLMMVEFSTVRESFVTSKVSIEASDLEDSGETEDSPEDFIIEKFFVENHYFQFKTNVVFLKIPASDDISTVITKPFRAIDSPPPQFFFI